MYNGELSCLLKNHIEQKHVDGGMDSVHSVDVGVNICEVSITKDKGKNVLSSPLYTTRVSVKNKVIYCRSLHKYVIEEANFFSYFDVYERSWYWGSLFIVLLLLYN